MYKNLIYFMSFCLVLGMTAGTTNAELIAYWPFDEGSGDVALDVVGGFEAQLTDMDWVTGFDGGGSALESSRGGDEIRVDPAPSPPAGGDLSMAWWMVDTYDSWHTMMNKYETASVEGNGILLRPTSEDSPLRWRLGGWQAYGGWGDECRVPAGAYSDGEWTHVTCVFDSAADTASIYINAELPLNGNFNPKVGGIAGPTGYTGGVNDPAQNLVIIGQQETYGGILDDIAMWDHPLTPEEVLAVYTLGPQGIDTTKASRPQPGDAAGDIPRDGILAWTPGDFALSHNVFMGTSFEDANNASLADPLGTLLGQDLTGTDLDPGRLEFGETYYWRVDEVNGPPDNTVFSGVVWSFTVEPIALPITDVTVTASGEFGNSLAEKTIDGSGLTDDLHGTVAADMWISTELPATIEYSFGQVHKLHELWIWNSNQVIEGFVGFGAKDIVIETSVDGENWTVLDGVGPLAPAPGAEGYRHNNTVDLGGATAQHVRVTVNSVQGVASQASLSEVRFFSIPVLATGPTPFPGAVNVGPEPTLSWTRDGREADRHDVYVGTNADDLPLAGTVSESSFSTAPLDLALGTTYTWRVDEVNEAMDPSVWMGELWSFTTVDTITVDDMESYKDEELLEIWATWIDGFDDPANNGSVVGGVTGTPEGDIVQGGSQSLPMDYDNRTAPVSEATRTFDAPMDWSGHGVQSLVLYFQGSPSNTGGSFYVKINDTKLSYDGDADSLMRGGWNKWVILLRDLAGVDLSNIRSITIGVDGGGNGVVYVDSIALATPGERDLVTPTEPGGGVVLHLPFDGDYQDASGNGLHGTPMGLVPPEFVAGHMGQAASFDGIDQYVEITGYKGITATDPATGDLTGVNGAFSVALWVQTTAANGSLVGWGSSDGAGDGGQYQNFRINGGTLRAEHGNGNWRGNTVVNDGEWHHVALAAVEGANLTPPNNVLYVDGQPDSFRAQGNMQNIYNLRADADVALGRRASHGDRWYTGLMDDVRIYDRALSAEEVAGLSGRTQPFDRP